MPGIKGPMDLSGKIVKQIESLPAPAPNRDTEGGVLQTTGHLALNANGQEMWTEVILANKLDPSTAAVRFSAIEASRLVLGYAVDPGTAGATKVTVRDRSASMHLGGVFTECPKLRPVGKRKVTVSTGLDGDKVLCLVIHLSTAETKRTTTRTAGSGKAKTAKPLPPEPDDQFDDDADEIEAAE